jgi:PAS domain S-box-containing protein
MPIAILGLVSLSFVAYRFINTVIEKELSDSMLASVGKSAESINRWLATIMIEPETIASTPAAKRINEDFTAFDIQNINRHKILHEKHSDIFQDIYAANSKGEYHTVQQNGSEYSIFVGDIQNRPYFISIMAGGPTQITPPLISRTTGIPTIFMVSPIIDEHNRPQGLVGAGISLRYIQQIAEGLKAGKTGYGFIVASDGTFISHPDPNFVMQKKITEIEAGSEEKLGKLMIAGGSGQYRYTLGKQGMVAFYQPIPITGWSVATVLPASELFAPAVMMVKLLTFITLIFVIFIGTAIALAMQRLIRPLQTLAARTREIAAGNLEGAALKVTSQDEIGVLSQSFNTMTDNLQATLSGLKDSEDNYRGIFENSINGILQTTLDGQILNANPAMARMLNCDSTEQLFASYKDVENQLYVDPDNRRKLISLLLEKGSVHDMEVQFYRRDHETIWVSISAFLVRDSAGNPIRLEGLISDISDRKQAEHEREALFEQLVQAQKLDAVGQLAGGVAHDFNNMLAVILGHTQLALLKIKPSEPFYKPFTEIQNAAEHSANLTRQLLAFARKQTVAPKIVDINQTLHGTFNLLRRLISEDIEITLNPANKIWPIFIDPDQVGQILTNLCLNARDAIDGNGRITIETHNIYFDTAYCANFPDYLPGEYVCLAVSDTGSGIDKAAQEHIFEPFFTTKEVTKGTGLGLSTVYGIVKQNNAFINLYSEPGQGSTFRIYFPRHVGTAQTVTTLPSTESLSVNMGMVLVVEDEPRLLNISREILEELDCQVLTAGSSAEAIEIAEDMSYNIDLLITDVIMPEMNGRELASRITKTRPDIRCIFMSGYTADIIAHKGVLDIGINFIQKPFSVQDLAAKINEVMALP